MTRNSETALIYISTGAGAHNPQPPDNLIGPDSGKNNLDQVCTGGNSGSFRPQIPLDLLRIRGVAVTAVRGRARPRFFLQKHAVFAVGHTPGAAVLGGYVDGRLPT